MPRLYNVIAIVERPGTVNHANKFYLSDESKPMTHKEACTFMSKITKYSWRRVLLEESV